MIFGSILYYRIGGKTVKETLDFMHTGQMGNSVLCPATQMESNGSEPELEGCLFITAQSKLAQKVCNWISSYAV